MKNGKAHPAINIIYFKRLGYINDQLYELELVKSENENKEPIVLGFFTRQYAELKTMEL